MSFGPGPKNGCFKIIIGGWGWWRGGDAKRPALESEFGRKGGGVGMKYVEISL
jgi:hypothetical protein